MALYEGRRAYPESQWNPYESAIDRAETRSTFLNGVYRHMALGLGVTGVVAMLTASSPGAMADVLAHPILLILAQLGVVVALTALLNRIGAGTALALFYGYSALTGLLLSAIFLAFTAESIAATFFVTGGTFAAMSAYGYLTKRDLSGFGSFLMMGLIGVVIASLVNIWIQSSMLMWLVTYLGIFIFVGLTAYDTQKIKNLAQMAEPGESYRKLSIRGALMLYLDFINLFLYLLRIFGRRR